MSPNNILNMAMLNKLDIISVTDHNSTLQLKNISLLQDSYDFLVIPGVEVSVQEGFDVLCYFRTFEIALEFGTFLQDYLTDNWGDYKEQDQVITDIYDNEMETYNKPLTDTTITYSKLYQEVKKRKGILILAHIDRPSCTPLSTYKLEDIEFDAIEISPYKKDSFLKENDYLYKYKMVHNSDSHTLLQIHEEAFSIELKDKTIESFFNYFEE